MELFQAATMQDPHMCYLRIGDVPQLPLTKLGLDEGFGQSTSLVIHL
jgi:hypothetical protein